MAPEPEQVEVVIAAIAQLIKRDGPLRLASPALQKSARNFYCPQRKSLLCWRKRFAVPGLAAEGRYGTIVIEPAVLWWASGIW